MPAADDRFASWPQTRARILLAAVAALLALAALLPEPRGKQPATVPGLVGLGKAAKPRPRDDDLKLYDIAIERIRHGENYYAFIVAEHRRAQYPVRPAIAVRLPTLAYLDAALGPVGQTVAAIALMLACLAAWWRRLGEEPGGRPRRKVAVALLFMGVSLGLNRYYFVLHELWAGMLVVLAMGLHRPARPDAGRTRSHWIAAFAVTALALAIRELVLPFVLLLAANAFWRGARREALAWSVLVLAFLGALAIHLHIIGRQVLPSDPLSPSWLALRGLQGWLSNIVLSSNLRFLPHWLAGPVVILMVLGWAGWKSSAGSFATLLYLGYGLAFIIAGRNDNFYWGMIVAPGMFIGLAFAPRALESLWRASSRKVIAR
ncbi:MAG: hypothetical protein JF593_05950 [Novosphingobium sp.]|nr:hypothetical protein [Novosphingobium sp.]